VDLSDWQFDAVVKNVLISLGCTSPLVIGLITLAAVIDSWRKPAEKMLFVLARLYGLSQRGMGVVRDTPRLRRISNLAITCSVLTGQVLAVFLCFLCGNWLSLATGQRKFLGSPSSPSWDELYSAVTVDWVSLGYVLLSVAIFAASYRARGPQGGRESLGRSLLMAFPATVLLPFFYWGPWS
jgi:hypothetical protein